MKKNICQLMFSIIADLTQRETKGKEAIEKIESKTPTS